MSRVSIVVLAAIFTWHHVSIVFLILSSTMIIGSYLSVVSSQEGIYYISYWDKRWSEMDRHLSTEHDNLKIIPFNWTAFTITSGIFLIIVSSFGTFGLFSMIWLTFMLALGILALYRGYMKYRLRYVYRALRCERRGDVSGALRWLYAARLNIAIEALLRGKQLPDWPIRDALAAASKELLHLRRDAEMAQAKRVSAALTDRLVIEAGTIADALWTTADRLAGIRSQHLDPKHLQPGLRRQEDNLKRIVQGVRQIRLGLAQALLEGGASVYLEAAISTLEQLGTIARTLE